MYRPCDHYILSRISIPFGMLSVCTGQVTHALLTRPPLTPKGSLDLHVLGTPPAFILSQDQTLMLKFFASLRKRQDLNTKEILQVKMDLAFHFYPFTELGCSKN